MTDQEINEAVAKKLGRGHIKDGWEKVCVIPDYCNNIAAAWDVVEWLRKEVIYVNIQVDVANPENNEPFLCELIPPGGCGGRIQETADTAPMAICIAFLELMPQIEKTTKKPKGDTK